MFVFCLVFFGSFRFHPRDGPWIKATGIENVMETLRNPSGSNRQRETLPPSPFTVRRPHSASPTGCPGCHGCRGCRRCRITDADADADAGFPFFFSFLVSSLPPPVRFGDAREDARDARDAGASLFIGFRFPIYQHGIPSTLPRCSRGCQGCQGC